jgi:hypothetical protein
MNDPQQTDYTPTACSPFFVLAGGELDQVLMEYNIAISNETSQVFHVPAGSGYLTNKPIDMIEIQELAERQAGSDGPFLLLNRREFPDDFPPTNSLVSWCYKNEHVTFNMRGANVDMEVRLNYIRRPLSGIEGDDKAYFNTNAEMFLIYKTAALCAMFIGENETRAEVLNDLADKALERTISISNKGKQQMMTRHRPFRYSYKMRGR